MGSAKYKNETIYKRTLKQLNWDWRGGLVGEEGHGLQPEDLSSVPRTQLHTASREVQPDCFFSRDEWMSDSPGELGRDLAQQVWVITYKPSPGLVTGNLMINNTE